MPEKYTPDNDPTLPTEFDVPVPGENVASSLIRQLAKAILNIGRFLNTRVVLKGQGGTINADTLDGKDSSDFWQKSEQLPSSGSGGGGVSSNADTLDGYDSTQFWKKTESVDAGTLSGYSATDFLRAGVSGIPRMTVVSWDYTDNGGYQQRAKRGYRADGGHTFSLVAVGNNSYRVTTGISNTAPLYTFFVNQLSYDGALQLVGGPNATYDLLVTFTNNTGQPGNLEIVFMEL